MLTAPKVLIFTILRRRFLCNSAMSSSSSHGDVTVPALLSRLREIDHTRVEHDQNVKDEALLLSRKLTASLEGPVNRATDLVFRVSG
jgi:hypothetical protein